MELTTKEITANVQTAAQFLKICDKFKLGCLLTEQQNPKTLNMSSLAKKQLPKAINMIKGLDIDTFTILKTKLDLLQKMSEDINTVLEQGGRIFICGCGATGRLALVLQTIWRQDVINLFTEQQQIDNKQCKNWQDRVIAFMAGGDAALIKSVQDFQDHPQFAQQQLKQLGFNENDMLIGSTQGGETPWVIGAIWQSTRISKFKPYILYGNTDQILKENVQRSRQFIESDKINKINCNVGHMALAGSTRMQSTTILMHAIGLALLGTTWMRKRAYNCQGSWKQFAENNLNQILDYINNTDFTQIAPLIQCQSGLYEKGQQITYITDAFYAISILTDTTQRSPTFSLNPFPNLHIPEQERKKCWANLKISNTGINYEGLSDDQITLKDWQAMLARQDIRGLNGQYWKRYLSKVSNKAISGFTLHYNQENQFLVNYPLNFQIKLKGDKTVSLQLPDLKSQPSRLTHHSLVKILLNNLSTLIMGRLQRYQSNIMTYVRPTNYKLIDRATRYVILLLKQQGLKCSYQKVIEVIYEIKDKIQQDEPIVLKVINQIKQRNLYEKLQ